MNIVYQEIIVEYLFKINSELFDVAVGILFQYGFTGFLEEDDVLYAYIPQSIPIDENEMIRILEGGLNCSVLFSKKNIAPKNWNKAWENSLTPIVVPPFEIFPFDKKLVDGKNMIPNPSLLSLYINPKMSFGTGSHETTTLMLQAIAKVVKENDTIIDIGSGTGILAIACRKLGNKNKILGLDNDEWAIKNSQENVLKNECLNIEFELKDIINDIQSILSNQFYSIVLANINLHIIKDILPELSKHISIIILSGILVYDKEDIIEYAHSLGFEIVETSSLREWLSLIIRKKTNEIRIH